MYIHVDAYIMLYVMCMYMWFSVCRYLSVGNDTDHEMVVLKMVDVEENPLGMIDWFAVHCTSMNNTNVLISGDNKGYASYLMEEDMSPPGTLPGTAKFVAAFAQSNEGDVSPNTKGPHCLDTGKPCDLVHSTCDGKVSYRTYHVHVCVVMSHTL